MIINPKIKLIAMLVHYHDRSESSHWQLYCNIGLFRKCNTAIQVIFFAMNKVTTKWNTNKLFALNFWYINVSSTQSFKTLQEVDSISVLSCKKKISFKFYSQMFIFCSCTDLHDVLFVFSKKLVRLLWFLFTCIIYHSPLLQRFRNSAPLTAEQKCWTNCVWLLL